VRSCPGLGECAARRDTAGAYASEPPAPRVTAFCSACSPTVCRREGRRTPTSDGPRACGCRWREADPGCAKGASFVRAVGESPGGRTRRRQSSGRWLPACSRSVGSVFFRRQLGIVAFFPGLRPTQLDLGALEPLSDGLDADRIHDALGDDEVSQLGQRPTRERLPQQVWPDRAPFR